MARSDADWDEEAFGGNAVDEIQEANARAKRRKIAHTAANFPKPDLTQPHQFRAVVNNYAHAYDIATPAEREEGRLWYPKVHEAVAKGVRRTGMSHLAGSALVAAVSPNMDWENNNINAFSEMHRMRPSQWDAVRKSAEFNAKFAPKDRHRTPEAEDALRGLSISAASDTALHKAHRILQGEDPETVLRRQTSPKTNSFMWTIHDPSGASHPGRNHPAGSRAPYVTIDARQNDLGTNRMVPWEFSGRGIGSADMPASQRVRKSGEPAKSFGSQTRYEALEEATRQAARAHDVEPHEMQATSWTAAKRIEREGETLRGGVRKQGVERLGQPYFPERQSLFRDRRESA